MHVLVHVRLRSCRLLGVASKSRFAKSFSVVILARNESVVERMYEFAQRQLLASPVQEPGIIAGDTRTFGATMKVGSCLVEVAATPRRAWQWHDRKGMPPDMLRIVGAGPGATMSSVIEKSSETVDGSSGVGRVFGRAISMLTGSGAPIPPPIVFAKASQGNSHARGASCSAASNQMSSRVKEVVLGLEGQGMGQAEGALEASGAGRDSRNLSVWRPVATQGELVKSMYPALRLLPSRYSALVLEMTTEAGHIQSVDSARETILSGAGSDLRAEVYGRRVGSEGSGQLVLSSALLTGLDLRVCSQVGLSMYFSEPQKSLTDHIDPVMNPDPNDPRKQQQLACNSVVGMEMLGLVKHKLGM